MKLVKKNHTIHHASAHAIENAATMDRRTFLKRTGITAGGVAAASSLSLSMMMPLLSIKKVVMLTSLS